MAEKPTGGEVINIHEYPLIHTDEGTGYQWGIVDGVYVAMDPETRQPVEDETLEKALARAHQASVNYRNFFEKFDKETAAETQRVAEEHE